MTPNDCSANTNWAPTVDGHLVPHDPDALLDQGKVNPAHIAFGANTNDSFLFIKDSGFLSEHAYLHGLRAQAYGDKTIEDELVSLYPPHANASADNIDRKGWCAPRTTHCARATTTDHHHHHRHHDHCHAGIRPTATSVGCARWPRASPKWCPPSSTGTTGAHARAHTLARALTRNSEPNSRRRQVVPIQPVVLRRVQLASARVWVRATAPNGGMVGRCSSWLDERWSAHIRRAPPVCCAQLDAPRRGQLRVWHAHLHGAGAGRTRDRPLHRAQRRS
jgi:hypothetical protein